MPGGTVRVTCRVPRDEKNRWLDVGIADLQASRRQLDGEKSRITWEFYFDHIPCGVGEAYCRVITNTGQQSLAHLPIEVTNCEP